MKKWELKLSFSAVDLESTLHLEMLIIELLKWYLK